MEINRNFGWLVILGVLLGLTLAIAAPGANHESGLRSGKLPSQPTLRSHVAEPAEARMPGHMNVVPSALHGQRGPWVAPQTNRSHLDTPATYWVDDSWTSQGDVDLFNNALTWQTDAFASIQQAIDASTAGDIVNVLPGNYTEAAPGRYVLAPSGQGPHQFGLFIDIYHNGLTLRGVDASGSPITSYGAVAAHVGLNASNDFGPSGLWVEGDNVTVTGLDLFETGTFGYNKTVEDIGNNSTFKFCTLTDGASLYIDDWRFDNMGNTSYLQSYDIESNEFTLGTSVDIASGAGFSGPVSGRKILNNTFLMSDPADYWPAISFNGSDTGVPWFIQSVGGAQITGNTFTQAEVRYIRARGTYDNSQFDWQSYFTNNSYDKSACAVEGGNWANSLRTWSYLGGYGIINDVRDIGVVIQTVIDNAQGTDEVLVGAGTYNEWDIAVNVPITIQGTGATTIVDATSYVPTDNSHNVFALTSSAGNTTVEQLEIKSGRINGIHPANNADGSAVVTIDQVDIQGNGYNTDPYPGEDFAIISQGMAAKVVVSNCNLHDTYQNVMLFELQLGETDIHNNTITDAYTVFYMTYNGNDVTTLQKFHHNTLSGGEIYFNSASQFYAPTTAGKYTNIEVSDNTFNNIVDGMRAMGAGNDNGVTPADGEIVAPRFLRNTVNGVGGGSNFRGLQLLGYITNADVENNYIHGVDVGIRLWQAYTPGVFPVGTKIYHNSILNCGTKAVKWEGPGDLNASVNYWGAAPSFGTIFTGSVDYTPWCQVELGTYNNPGYTPNLSQLMVEAGSPQTGLVNRVQEGINETVGSTVNLSAGTFVGQDHITLNNLTLSGAGVALTTVQADPGAMALTDPDGLKPVIFVDGATNVHITNLKVDGDGKVAVNGNNMSGISYWNSDGLIQNVDVVNVNGGDYGYAIFADNSDVPAHVLNLTSVNVNTYSYQGVFLHGDGLSSTLTSVSAVGHTTNSVWVGGFDVGYGASADFNQCASSDHYDQDFGYFTTGYWIDGQADFVNCTSTNDLEGYSLGLQGVNCSLTGCTTTNSLQYAEAFYTADFAYSAPDRANTPERGSKYFMHRRPSNHPMALNRGSRGLDNSATVTLTNCSFTGPGAAGAYSAGVIGQATDQYGGPATLTFNVSGCNISGYQFGLGAAAYGTGGIVHTGFSNNQVSNVQSYSPYDLYAAGIHVEAGDAGTLDGTINGNKVTSSIGPGAQVFEWHTNPYTDPNAPTSPGTTAPTLTNNIFATPDNTFDDHPTAVAGRWNANCYSDYGPSHAGYPNYNIGGGVQVDANPNTSACSSVNLSVADPNIGCSSPCNTDVLYITLDVANLPNLHVMLQMPAGFTATGGIVGGPLMPGFDPNLIQAFASVSGSVITLDMGFSGSGSSGGGVLYVAAIPIATTDTTGTYTFSGNSSLWIDGMGGNHVNEFILGSVDVNVDCTAPVISNFANAATCSAFGSGTQMVGQLSALLTDANSDLDEAWVTFAPEGGTFNVFGPNQASPYTATFPVAADSAAFYGHLVEGCNTLTFHLKDAECNLATTVDLVVGRDNTAPSLTVTNTTPMNFCYNNTPMSSHYGGAFLDDYLDITSLLGSNLCSATTGSLIISHAGVSDFVRPLDQLSYPASDSAALALWNWMLTVPGLASANDSSFTFDVNAVDCAENYAAPLQFTICVDTQAPTNTVSTFDARPADAAVWLKWQWTASSQAVEMRVYRSPISGEYPAYPSDLWNSLANYPTASFPPTAPSPWTLVATQTALSGTQTSTAFTGNNLKGFDYHHSDYWLDTQPGWVDGQVGPFPGDSGPDATTWRDIYRYVTFVKDAGGNWSVGYSPAMGTNADRSTNYWLGDFAPADSTGPNNSRGRVDSDDLGLLSSKYFTTTPGDFRNIGPVVVENGSIGKGIPNPEVAGNIDFQDLVPFSFNYGTVSPDSLVGTEYRVDPNPGSLHPFGNLDAMPAIALSRTTDTQLSAGDEFSVVVTVSGNETNVVKAVEARVEYDPAVFEYVSGTASQAAVDENAVLFSKVALIGGQTGKIGLVAAACGDISTLHGNLTLGTLTFRVKTADIPFTRLSLDAPTLLDNTGATITSTASTLTLGGEVFVPATYALYQNYPNPFNPNTTIRYDLKDAGHVTIAVFNVLGQEVATLINGDMPAGHHTLTFDASKLTSGLYIYTIHANGFSDRKKMLLMK